MQVVGLLWQTIASDKKIPIHTLKFELSSKADLNTLYFERSTLKYL